MTSVAHEVPLTGDRWRGRPVLADLLRGGLLAVPLVSSVSVVYAVGSLIPVDAQRSWWALTLVLVTAVVTAVVSERASQRLLPLTVLLQLTMIFPDRAPSRLRLARTAVAGPPTELIWSGGGATTTADTVLALMSALGAHDRRTRGHSERVRVLCDVLAAELRLDQGARDRLRWAALLHDVGKMAVAPGVLNKPAALDAREFDAVREHPVMGASISAPLLPWLGEWGRGIVEHHERYDGSGYPAGLAGQEISEAGRIVALVDAFETMTAARAYKKPMATKAAREELARCAGTQFDPVHVRAFLNVSLPRMMWALGPVSFLVHAPFLRSLAEAGARSSAATGQAAASAAGVAVIATAGVGTLATATAETPPVPATAAPAAPGTGPTTEAGATAPLLPPDAQATRAPKAPSVAGTASSPTDLGTRPGTTSTPVGPGSPRLPEQAADGRTGSAGTAEQSGPDAPSRERGTSRPTPRPAGTAAPGADDTGSDDTGSDDAGSDDAGAAAPGKAAPGRAAPGKTDPGGKAAPDTAVPDKAAPDKAAPGDPRKDTAPARPEPPPTDKPPVVTPPRPAVPPVPAMPPLPVALPTLPPLTPADRAVRLEQAPEPVTTDRTAVFRLVTASGLDLQCRDTTDGRGLGEPEAGWAPCDRTVTFPGLAPGSYTFQTRSVDSAGRRGAVQTHSWRVVDGLRGSSLGPADTGSGSAAGGDRAAELGRGAVEVTQPLFSRGRLPF